MYALKGKFVKLGLYEAEFSYKQCTMHENTLKAFTTCPLIV